MHLLYHTERQMYICFIKIKKCVRIQKSSFPALGHLHKKTKKAKILMMTKDSGFLMIIEILFDILSSEDSRRTSPLKIKKKKINVFLRGSCFRKLPFFHIHTVSSVQTASFVTGTRIRSPARIRSERIWFNFWILSTICSVFSPSALYAAAMSQRVSPE